MRRVGFTVLVLLGGCGDGQPAAFFPHDYATTYQMVRSCRHSLDHDVMNIRVLASPEAVTPYLGRSEPFPVGAIVLKEQYDENDTACAGPIINFTVMRKLDSATNLGWEWQKVDAKLEGVDTDLGRCINCHTMCGQPPDGYDGTCTVP